MIVVVRHGHFALYPQTDAEVWRFIRLFKIDLEPEADYFTLPGLVGLPRWSIAGGTYGTLPAIATHEGRHASDVMRANGFVYSLAADLLVPYATITASVDLPETQNAWRAPTPLVQPGALLKDGSRLMSYRGALNMDTQRLYIYSRGGLDE